MRNFRGYFIVFALLLSTNARTQKLIIGKTVAITDGDTFKLLQSDSTLIRVRIANIDCPENKQPFSNNAKKFTSDAIFNKYVTIEALKKDRYGRIIANVMYNDSLNLGKELLKAGLAWHFVKYSDDKSFQLLHDVAKSDKRGLWQDPHAIPPWNWRDNRKKKRK